MKHKSLYRGFLIVFSASMVIVIASLLLTGYSLYRLQLRSEATSVADEIVAFRRWVAQTSVVWVNKLHPDFTDFLFKREFDTGNSVYSFFAKNPALATRELSKMYASVTKGTTFRVTSDRYRNPLNKPDDFELMAIGLFNDDKKLQFYDGFDGGFYRYSQPLKVVKSCLKCHGRPEDAPREIIEKYGNKAFNYKIGDIRGIITVNIPGVGLLSLFKTFNPFMIGSGIALLLIVGFNYIWFRKRVVQPINSINSVMRQVREGRYDQRIQVTTHDELSDIADIFNETMDKIRGYIQTEEEQKQTQSNVIKLLDVVSSASEGDLTLKAPVTADVFGSIADAFNLMVNGLASLLSKVRGTAEMVQQESQKMTNLFTDMSRGAEQQTLEFKKTSKLIDESVNTTREIIDKVKQAQEISQDASSASSSGSEHVKRSLAGIQIIRATTQTINKRMKVFSERLLEIGTISQLIAEVSARTNLLAMNASIEAARAGEYGKGFVVIAEEIRSLADRSNEASKQITDIIKAIQTEAGEVNTALEEEVDNVEKQSATANATSNIFKDIEASISQSNDTVSEIYYFTERHRELSNSIVQSMEEVNKISLKMLKTIKNTTNISSALSNSSTRMIDSTLKFNLPQIES